MSPITRVIPVIVLKIEAESRRWWWVKAKRKNDFIDVYLASSPDGQNYEEGDAERWKR